MLLLKGEYMSPLFYVIRQFFHVLNNNSQFFKLIRHTITIRKQFAGLNHNAGINHVFYTYLYRLILYKQFGEWTPHNQGNIMPPSKSFRVRSIINTILRATSRLALLQITTNFSLPGFSDWASTWWVNMKLTAVTIKTIPIKVFHFIFYPSNKFKCVHRKTVGIKEGNQMISLIRIPTLTHGTTVAFWIGTCDSKAFTFKTFPVIYAFFVRVLDRWTHYVDFRKIVKVRIERGIPSEDIEPSGIRWNRKCRNDFYAFIPKPMGFFNQHKTGEWWSVENIQKPVNGFPNEDFYECRFLRRPVSRDWGRWFWHHFSIQTGKICF